MTSCTLSKYLMMNTVTRTLSLASMLRALSTRSPRFMTHSCEICVQLTSQTSAEQLSMTGLCDKMVAMVPWHSPPVGAAQCCFWKMRQALGWKPACSLPAVYRSLCVRFFPSPLQWLLSALSPVFQALSQLCSCSCCSEPAALIRLLPHYLSRQPSSEQQIHVVWAHPAKESKTAILNTRCGKGILLQALLLQTWRTQDNTGFSFFPLLCVWC